MKGLTELYDRRALSSLRFASLVFYNEQAFIFKIKIGPAERECHPFGKRHPEPEHRKVYKAVHNMVRR
jgi:hypothetical protein